MLELSQVRWDQANTLLRENGVETNSALNTLRDLGWTFYDDPEGQPYSPSKPLDVIYLEESKRTIVPYVRQLSLILETQRLVDAAVTLWPKQDEEERGVLEDEIEKGFNTRWRLNKALQRIEVSAQGEILLIGGESTGTFWTQRNALVLSPNGGVSLVEQFIPIKTISPE